MKKGLLLEIERYQIHQMPIANIRGLDGRSPKQSQRSQENRVMRNKNISWLIWVVWEPGLSLRPQQGS